MTEIVEIMALAALNRDRVAGGWPPVESRDNIPDSEGYVEGAQAALTALREHYAVAPREATVGMIGVGWSVIPCEWDTPPQEDCDIGIDAIYSAMLAAAEREV